MYYFRNDLIDKKSVNIDVPHKKIMMCLNESYLNPFSVLKNEIIRNLEKVPFNRYYNDVTQKLKQTLSEYVGTPENNLAFGNGADEMLYLIFNSVRQNNESFAVSLAPSYFDYQSYSRAVGLGIKFLDLERDFDFDVEKFVDLSDDKNCRLVILCNPNNPTGNLLNEQKILQVLSRNQQRLVMIDETYFEFSGKTFLDKIEQFPNLAIVRSFSKAFSTAGLRFGYVISNIKNIRELTKVMTVFHSSLMIQSVVLTMLENKELFLEQTRKVVEYRNGLYSELFKIAGIKVKNTETNFLPFTVGKRSKQLYNFLSDNEIAVRDIGFHPILNNYLRVSISCEDDNKIFLKKVREFLLQ